MKLLAYTTRSYLLFSVILFVVISSSVFVILQHISLEEIDERMESTQTLLIHQIENGVQVESFWPYWEVQSLPVDFEVPSYSKDTLIITPDENEEERFQQRVFQKKIGDEHYLFIIRTPQVVSYNLLIATGLPVLVMLLFWMIALFLINRRISFKIWRPFRKNLDRISRFSVADANPLQLEASQIDELEELRMAISRLADKGISDFRNLREFTENASHEIQTPLSIIHTQLEQLMQSPHLRKEIAGELDKIYTSIQRLSKVNKSLLLLSKLENRHFELSDSINLSEELRQNLAVFAELMNDHDLVLELDIQQKVIQQSNQELFRILVNNLVGNAIKHNKKGGNIKVSIDSSSFQISNSGQPSTEDPNRWFERFSKADHSSQSPGLGLAIAREICELHGWEISYLIKEDQHHIKVEF